MIKRIKLRTLFIGGCITLFFLVLIVRVFYVQVLQGEYWQDLAQFKWTHTSKIKAVRGAITDRNGSTLASDVPAYTVVVNPEVIHERGIGEEVIAGLKELLGKPENELRKLVEAKDEEGKFLKNREIRNEGWKIDQALADKVLALRDKLSEEHKTKETGLGLVREQKRYYPKDSLAAHVLGYTDRDGNAVMGFEKYFDEQLKGHDGELIYKSDGKGVKLPNADEAYQPVVNGNNFKLTIDSTIQYYIEEAMKKAFNQYKPKSMTVIAADPNTMEVLGMANMPTFNPNKFWDADQASFLNHAIKSIYEPGSTFKIATLAGAVEEKVFKPDDTFMSGAIRIKGYSKSLHDIKKSGWGPITYLEGVKRSSNVAFVKLGYEMLGPDRLLKYIEDFGFKEKTGIDLPGEVTGRVSPKYAVEYATLAYGHGKVQVTPIEQLTAVAAIANGGKLMVPHVVKEVTNPNTGQTSVTQPEVVRQVISEQSARETGGYLEQVVADQTIGTGRHAYIEGYRVAGKTGTAIKVIGQDYVKSKVLVSFIGYAPVNDPKIAVIVIIDEPNVEVGGGTAAAPVFKEIVSQSLQYMGVPKTVSKDSEKEKSSKDNVKASSAPVVRTAPDLTGKAMKEARELLLDGGYDFESIGQGASVMSQYPAAGTKLASGQRIYLLSQEGDASVIPNLKGQSLRDALEVLSLLKVGIVVEGEGYVTEQIEGTKNGKKLITLKLTPLNEPGKVEQSDQPESSSGEATDN
jgi:penicillin-binding protein 2B